MKIASLTKITQLRLRGNTVITITYYISINNNTFSVLPWSRSWVVLYTHNCKQVSKYVRNRMRRGVWPCHRHHIPPFYFQNACARHKQPITFSCMYRTKEKGFIEIGNVVFPWKSHKNTLPMDREQNWLYLYKL